MDQKNTQERYEYLASAWKNKTITPTEESELFDWLNLSGEIVVNIPASFANSETELKNQMYDYIDQSLWTNKQDKKRKLWPKLSIAAALLLLTGASLLFYYSPAIHHLFNSTASLNNHISTGSNTATLTLANGKKIKLSAVAAGQISTEAGVSISKSKDGKLIYSVLERNIKVSDTIQLNTLSTAVGETYQIRLPDGTRVWLNAASSLKYPANFGVGSKRKVQLSGEAYFEVAKLERKTKGSVNTHVPFSVVTDKQEIEVLGTHFNISSYQEESTEKTTLLEGAVRVSLLNASSKNVNLLPNQQAVLTAGKLSMYEVDAAESVAWKNGKFTFDHEDINSIMRKVARWYNIEVVYQDNLEGVKLTGSISRFENISKLLEILENTKQVHFKIDGKRIIVKK
jgi:transmembrane sensor